MVTTIQLNETTHEALKSRKGNGESFDDVITDLIAGFAGCPKCGEGELVIDNRPSVFSPLRCGLKCEKCGYEKEWKAPFKGGEK